MSDHKLPPIETTREQYRATMRRLNPVWTEAESGAWFDAHAALATFTIPQEGSR